MNIHESAPWVQPRHPRMFRARQLEAVIGRIIGSVLAVVAVLMFVTAAIGYCPTYRLLGVSTDPTPHRVASSGTRLAARH
jgi:Protein of unknown function (DUF2892)